MFYNIIWLNYMVLCSTVGGAPFRRTVYSTEYIIIVHVMFGIKDPFVWRFRKRSRYKLVAGH